MKALANLTLLLCIVLIGINCSKDSSAGPDPIPVPKEYKYFFKIKVDGVQYEYGFDSTGCDVYPSTCTLGDPDSCTLGGNCLPRSGFQYINGQQTDNWLALSTDTSEVPNPGANWINIYSKSNCSDTSKKQSCMSGILEAYNSAKAYNAYLSLTIGDILLDGDGAGSTDTTYLEVNTTKYGPVGTPVTGTFSGRWFKRVGTSDPVPVNIEGSYSLMRVQ